MDPIVLPVVSDYHLRHRVQQREFFRTLIVWASVVVSAFSFGLLVVTHGFGMLAYSFPYAFAVVHLVYAIGLMSPYCLLWSSLTATSAAATTMILEMDEKTLSLRGSGFRCRLPVQSLRGAHMLADALMLSTTYPLDALILRRPASSEEEVALFGVLAENGIACSGAWCSSIRRTPPPLPSAGG